MTKFTLALVALVSSIASAAPYEPLTKFEASALREKLLNLKNHPPKSRLVLEGESSDPKKREFVEYYRDMVYPRLQEFMAADARYSALHILVDTYIHTSEEERTRWAGKGGELEQAMKDYNNWSVDPKWTHILATWAQKAEGLTGKLPDAARRMHKARQLGSFEEQYKPWLDEASRLENEYMIAVNEVPAAKDVKVYRKRQVEIRREYKDGAITFEEAQKQMRELMATMGLHFVGYQAVQKSGENLNEMAKLRSQLAKTKGYPTWAAYMLEVSGQGYTEEYRGPKNQREFLREYIRGLSVLEHSFIERRIQELGLEAKRDTLRAQHTGLLTLPGTQQLQPYFPSENTVKLWEETLLESGFRAEDIRQITLDIVPREGKNATAAYMSGLVAPYTETDVLDADKLEFKVEPKGSPNYKPGFIMILQNFGGTGIPDLTTLFHEGGHALNHILQFKTEGKDESYGYIEVPSMTSERYASDLELLFNRAVEHNGRRPTRDEIRTLLANDEQNEVVNLLGMATSALYDLELWDYDYSAPGAQTYLQRVEAIEAEVNKLAGDLPDIETPVPLHYWKVSTSHFVSGAVRNIGYTYAEIASRMMSKYLSDELERLTGRRSWYQQPELGRLFTEKFFEQGWKDQFPANIEKITGAKFSAEQVVHEMAEELRKATCEAKLNPGGPLAAKE
jgi:hypothetical protein